MAKSLELSAAEQAGLDFLIEKKKENADFVVKVIDILAQDSLLNSLFDQKQEIIEEVANNMSVQGLTELKNNSNKK